MSEKKNTRNTRVTELEARLLKENEDLRIRLSEAEEALNSIRNGEVDAIVVAGEQGEKIFSLTSAETPYRIIIEEMQEGAVTLNKEAKILYANKRFSDLTGLSSSQIVGNSLVSFIEQEESGYFTELLNRGRQERSTGTFKLVSASDKQEYCLFTFSPLAEGIAGDICVIISSITEIKQFEQQLSKLVEARTIELEKINKKLRKDIDQRIELENRLIHSEHIMSYFLDAVPVGVIRWNASGPITSANDQFLKMIGYTREDLDEGRIDWTKLTLPEYEERDKEAFEEFYRTGKCYPYEKAYYRKDGSIVPILVSSVLVSEEDQEGIGFVLDLSELKNKENYLRESERKYRELVKYAPTGIYEINFLTQRFVTVNDAMTQLSGYSREELMAMNPIEIIEPENRGLFLFRIRETQQGRVPSDVVEYKVRRKDGKILDVILNVSYRYSEDKKNITGAFVVGHDITERKQMERALQEAMLETNNERNKLKALYSISPAGIFMLNREGEVTFVNKMGIDLYQMDPTGLPLQQHIRKGLAYPDGRPYPYEELPATRSLLRGEVIVNEEMLLKRPDGSSIYITESTAPMKNTYGETEAVIGIFQDVTLFKKTQEELAASRNLAEAQKNKLETLFRISPLGIIVLEKETQIFSFVNDTAKRIFGFDPTGKRNSEVTSIKIFNLDETPVEVKDMPSYRTLVFGETVSGEEYILEQPSGKQVYVSVNTAPFLNPNGEVEAMIAIFDDITISKKNEKKLSYQSYLLDNIGDAIIASDKDFHVTYWNKGAEKLYGWKAEEVLGKIGPDILGTRFAVMSRETALAEALRKGTYEAEVIQRQKSGKEIHFQSVFSVLKDEKGNITDYISVNRDLTERLLMEQNLRQSEERFQKIFRNNPIAISISRYADGIFIDINQNFVDIFGYQRHELIGIEASRLNLYADPQDRQKITKILNDKGRVSDYEILARRKDGQMIYILLSAEIIDLNNEPHILFASRDITHRKKAEAALFESQAKLKAALDSMMDAIFISDAQGNFIHMNEAFAFYHRFANIEECSKTFADYPDILNVYFESGKPAPVEMWAVPRALRGERISNAEYILERKDTGEKWIGNYSFGPIRDSAGNIVGSVVTCRDVTENKKMERALRESEERYSSVFKNSPVAITLSSATDSRIIMVNEKFEELLGFTSSEIIGKTSVDLAIVTPEEQSRVADEYRKHGIIRDMECARKAKNGDLLIILLNVSPVTISGEKYNLTTIVDITERRKMEEAIRERERENALLANIIEVSSTAIAFSNLQGEMLYSNKALGSLTGYSREELSGMNWNKTLTAPEYREMELLLREELLTTHQPKRYEKENIRKDGSRIPVEVLMNVKLDSENNPQFVFAFLTDITERKLNEQKLHQLIRTLRAMQKSSQLMVHARDERKFLNDVCEIIVEDCGHELVWVGYKENYPKKIVRPVAWYGFDESYINNLDITWMNDERGKGPSGTAIRTGKVYICRDIATDPTFAPWRDDALSRGYASSIVLPLFINEEVMGVLNIYSRQVDPFTDEEQQLLMKLADDLAYGITAIRLNLELKRSKEDLEVKVIERTGLLQKTMHDLDLERKRFMEVLNMIPAYVILITQDMRIAFANRIFDETLREHLTEPDLIPRESRDEIKELFLGNQPNQREWNGPDNRIYQVSDFPYTDYDGTRLILEMGVDVTEKRNMERYVLSKILETEEKDRRRFASDLHDDLGPTLSAIKLQISMLSYEEEKESRDELLNIVDLLLSEGIEKMRNLANNIMPSLIESYGLETAVKSFIHRMEKSGQITFHFNSNLNGLRFDGETELHLYRVVTELINNTIKHSGATEVNVELKLIDNQLQITYCDNGIGYNIDANPLTVNGIGLQNINNRINLIKGNIEFRSKNGKMIVLINKDLSVS